MKNFVKLFSLVFAFVLMLSASVMLSGCTEYLSMKEGSQAMVYAAGDYHKNHVYYDNFADTTYTYTYDMFSSSEEEYTYKQAPESQREVTESKTNMTDVSVVITMSTHNTVIGSGVDAYKELYFALSVVSHEVSRYYSVDENNLLQCDSLDETTTINYVMASKLVDGVETYFVTMNKVVSHPDEVDQVTKEYYEFSSKADYHAGNLVSYLEKLNELVDASFFFAQYSEAFYPLIICEKEGDRITMGVETTIPLVDGAPYLVTSSRQSTIYGNKLGVASTKTTMNAPYSLGHTEGDISLKVEYSSNAISLPSLTDYDEVFSEIEIKEIPANINPDI